MSRPRNSRKRPEAPQQPEQQPEAPQQPEQPEAPQQPEQPEAPQQPEQQPEAPQQPEQQPEAPQQPEQPAEFVHFARPHGAAGSPADAATRTACGERLDGSRATYRADAATCPRCLG